MTEENVVKGKGGRGAVREVRDGERGRGTTVFVQQEQIRKSGGIGTSDKGREDQCTAVQANRCGDEKSDFLGKGRQPR